MNLFQSLEELTQLGKFVYDENLEALEEKVVNGLKIDAVVDFSDEITDTLINFAIYENKKNVVNWLLSKGAKYNYNDTDSSLFLTACKSFDFVIVKLLLDKGANANAKDRVGNTTMTNALYGENFDIIKLLIDYGYDLRKDGVSLRQAVFDKQYQAIKIFLENNIDVNYHTADMVFPYNTSPVFEAVSSNNLEITKLLVKHGADITVKDDYGRRPYNAAVETKNKELIEYIKALEPTQYHNEEQKLSDLKKYNIPNEILDILRSKNRRIKIFNENVSFIEFHHLLDVKEVDWKKHKFIDLLSKVDKYGADGFLVWYPEKKSLAFADYEHQHFKILCTAKDFFKDPAKQIEKIFT